MNSGLEYYRPFGQPAQGFIRIFGVPVAGVTITIAGTTYTARVDFGGDSPLAIAESLVAAINNDRNKQQYTLGAPLNTPIKPVYAMYFGASATGSYKALVVVIATSPGTTPNAFGLSTNNSTYFGVPATLSGGTVGDGVAISGAVSLTGAVTIATIDTTPQSFLVLNASHLTATQISAASKPFLSATLVAAKLQAPWTANTGTVYLSQNNNITTQLFPIFAGGSQVITSPPGQIYDLNDYYINSDSDGDGLIVFYS